MVIEQAKGILAERLQVPLPDQAFILLRAYSRSNIESLTRIAGDVISGTAGIIAGIPPGPARPGSRPSRL